jgi:3-oxoadipate enol-lactonase
MNPKRTTRLSTGANIAFDLSGPEGAPWVVFSNSVLTDFAIWDGQVAALAQEYRILRYDQRGHGGSDAGDDSLSFEDYGADLDALLSELEIGACAFVGLSMGVPTGLAAYARAPERFRSFVAVDGVAKSAPGRAAFWTERRQMAASTGMAEIARLTVERWLPGEDLNAEQAGRLTRMIQKTPVQGFAAATHALSEYDQSGPLAAMAVPFLGIAGAEDGAMPAAMRRQFAAVKTAHFLDVPGAGHLPNFQSPDAFNTALTAFLNVHWPSNTKETV